MILVLAPFMYLLSIKRWIAGIDGMYVQCDAIRWEQFLRRCLNSLNLTSRDVNIILDQIRLVRDIYYSKLGAASWVQNCPS